MSGAPRTPSGYDAWEAFSALQKTIRRGEHKLAMIFALELEAAGMGAALFNRIRVIAHEDVGIANMSGVMFACRCMDDAERFHAAGKTSWRLCLSNAIYALASGPKTRFADEFQAAMRLAIVEGRLPEIPDYALDKHTKRGRSMGRGVDHFVDEGCELDQDMGDHEFLDDARSMWKQDKPKRSAQKTEKPKNLNGSLFDPPED